MLKKQPLYLIIILFALYSQIHSQIQNELQIFEKAQIEYENERYGSAIELLNQFLSNNPRNVNGYNLRGLSFEFRKELYKAVLDFRIARNLKPNDIEYRENLDRATRRLILFNEQKIKGYQREIKIDSTNLVNYWRTGLSYKELEFWNDAEKWVGIYFNKKQFEKINANEVLIYTEILAQLNALQKAERIIKKHLRKFSNDWRILSRLGYLLLWQGKYDEAKPQFEKSLSIKPFFKEAEEGLAIVNRNALLTTNIGLYQNKIFPIDKYYKILKKAPEKNKIRLKLIDELIKHKRFSEAVKQFEILLPDYKNDKIFIKRYYFYKTIVVKKNKVELAKLENEFKSNPRNKKNTEKFIALLWNSGSAKDLFNVFKKTDSLKVSLSNKSNFRKAQVYSWNSEFEIAENIIDELLLGNPNNKDYKLLKAQLLNWSNKSPIQAESILVGLVKSNPLNPTYLENLIDVEIINGKLNSAKLHLSTLRKLENDKSKIIRLEENYFHAKQFAKRDSLLIIAQKNYTDKNCSKSVELYSEIIKIDSSYYLKREYAEALYCAGEYDKAENLIMSLIKDSSNVANYNLVAVNSLGKIDTASAIEYLVSAREIDSTNYRTNISLVDLLISQKKYDQADQIISQMKTQLSDSIQIVEIQKRILWLNDSQGNGNPSFPSYVGLSPSFDFYSDNDGFRLLRFGTGLDIGIGRIFTIGFDVNKYSLKSDSSKLNITSLGGHLLIDPIKRLRLGGYFGKNNFAGLNKSFYKFLFRYSLIEKGNIEFNYQKNSSPIILYSSKLLSSSFDVNILEFVINYKHSSGVEVIGDFQNFEIKDSMNNNAQQIKAIVGKRFKKEFFLGYRFHYLNYKYLVPLYYSPSNFESHSLYLKWQLEKTETTNWELSGFVGFIPEGDFVTREIDVSGNFILAEDFNLKAKFLFGSTFRSASSYNYWGGNITIYWTL